LFFPQSSQTDQNKVKKYFFGYFVAMQENGLNNIYFHVNGDARKTLLCNSPRRKE